VHQFVSIKNFPIVSITSDGAKLADRRALSRIPKS
jgi:hypothetical protein